MRRRQQQLHRSLDLLWRLAHLLNEHKLRLNLRLLLPLIVERPIEVLNKRLLQVDLGLAAVVDGVEL